MTSKVAFEDFFNMFKLYCSLVEDELSSLNPKCPVEHSDTIAHHGNHLKRRFYDSSFTYMALEKVSGNISDKQSGWSAIVSSWPRKIIGHLEYVLLTSESAKLELEIIPLTFLDRVDWSCFIPLTDLRTQFDQLYTIVNKDINQALTLVGISDSANEPVPPINNLFDLVTEDARLLRGFAKVKQLLCLKGDEWKATSEKQLADTLSDHGQRLFMEIKRQRLSSTEKLKSEVDVRTNSFVISVLEKEPQEKEENRVLLNDLFTPWNDFDEENNYPDVPGVFEFKTSQSHIATFIGLSSNLKVSLKYQSLKKLDVEDFALFMRRQKTNMHLRYKCCYSFAEAKDLFDNLKVLLKF